MSAPGRNEKYAQNPYASNGRPTLRPMVPNDVVLRLAPSPASTVLLEPLRNSNVASTDDDALAPSPDFDASSIERRASSARSSEPLARAMKGAAARTLVDNGVDRVGVRRRATRAEGARADGATAGRETASIIFRSSDAGGRRVRAPTCADDEWGRDVDPERPRG